MTTLHLSDGGDATGGTQTWDEVGGSVTVTTAEAHTGSRSFFTDTAAGTSAYLGKYGIAGATRRWSAWVRFRETASSHEPIWLTLDSGATTWLLGVARDSSGQIRLLANGPASANYVGTTGPVLAEDAWYRVSVAWSLTSTTVWTMTAWVDGSEACTVSNTPTLANTTPNSSYWGLLTSQGGSSTASIGLYLDDLIIDDGSGVDDIGDVIVTAKRPAGAGTNEFDTGIGSGTNRWDRVAEVPISETNGWREATPGSPTTERMPPDAVLASSGLSGATVANLDDDPDSGGTDFATASGNTTATSVRVSFATPSLTPAGTQEFRVQVRKNATAGTGTPTARIDLYENGSLISSGSEQNVTSTTGQVLSRTWDMTGRTASQIECLVAGTPSGGGPSVRAAVDIGAIEWNAAAPAAAAKETYALEGVSAGDVDLTGKTLVARLAWVWAKASAAGTAYLIDNNTETAISLTTTSALYTRLTDTATYPSGTDQIGLRAVAGDTDTDLYECGAVIAALVPVTGDQTREATPATITAQSQTATITAGAVTLTAAVATLTAQAQAATLTATAPLTATPATLTAQAQTATVTPGAVSVSATPASVTAAAQSATVTAGSVTLEATPATVTSTAQAATLTASVTLDAGPATVTSTAQTATLTPGAVTLPATPAQITVTAQTASISTEAGPQDLEASPASITTSAQTAEISATVTLTAGPATITAEALTATTTPEIAVLEGGPANLTAQAQSVTLTPGSVTVEASPATVTAQAQTADVTAEAGDQTRNATPAEITATVPGAVLTAGAVTLTAGPATATVIGQTATITAGEGDQTVPAGPAGVTATAQTATISAGSVTIEASPATVTASAPVVEISAGVELSASPATALLVAAVAVLVAGAATIEGGPALITVSAQSATVTGGGTLPVVSSVAGGDRAAVTVAGGDRGMVAVVGRNRGMVAVAGGDQGATGVGSGDDRAVAVTGGDRRL